MLTAAAADIASMLGNAIDTSTGSTGPWVNRCSRGVALMGLASKTACDAALSQCRHPVARACPSRDKPLATPRTLRRARRGDSD
jgi:hypothetical protein